MISKVAQYKDLMDKKCEHVQDKKVHRKILPTVTVVMLDVVALVFQSVESFVFNFPAGAATFDHVPDVFPGDGQIGHPTVVIGGFSLSIDDPVLEKIYLIGIWGRVERHVVYPLIVVATALTIFEFKLLVSDQSGDLGDPFEQDLMVAGLGYQDIGHAVS